MLECICSSLHPFFIPYFTLMLKHSASFCDCPISSMFPQYLNIVVYYYLSTSQHSWAGKSNLAPLNAKWLPMCGNEPGSIAHPCFSKHLLTPHSAHCSQAFNCFSRFCGKSIQQWLDPPPYPTPPLSPLKGPVTVWVIHVCNVLFVAFMFCVRLCYICLFSDLIVYVEYEFLLQQHVTVTLRKMWLMLVAKSTRKSLSCTEALCKCRALDLPLNCFPQIIS